MILLRVITIKGETTMVKEVRTPTQKRSIDKTKKILNTAKALFSKKNYFNVTTNEIAKEAGVSIGTLYSYFSDKEAILVALLNDYNASFITIFDDINTQDFLELFKSEPRRCLELLINRLLKNENEEFHNQIEMLAFTIPQVKSVLENHNHKVKELTYHCFLHYIDVEESAELKALSTIIFNIISSTVDEIIYSNHSNKEKELLKAKSIDCIMLIINNAIELSKLK